MKVLIFINGSAYGLDSTYNAIRLAASLAKRDDVGVAVFLMGDGVTAAMTGQKTPDGYSTNESKATRISARGHWPSFGHPPKAALRFVLAAARSMNGRTPQVITQATEHPAVLAACRALQEWHGDEVTYLPVDGHGLINPDDDSAARCSACGMAQERQRARGRGLAAAPSATGWRECPS